METGELQQQLFTHLKEKLPTHLSLVDVLCELLDLSPDSVYRRIRGEKPITLNELRRICEKYHLSLDHLLKLENDSVLFHAPGMNDGQSDLLDYLKGMEAQGRFFNSFKAKEVRYLCKDIPFWYFYLFPEMAAFKSFFWSRTIHNVPSLQQKQFSLTEFPFHDCYLAGQQILHEFNQIPTIELWNLESINSTINQVAYYKEAGIFKTPGDLHAVIQSIHNTLDHLQMQAKLGVKFLPGNGESGYRAPVQVYINELILGNNTVLLTLDGQRVSIVTYSVLNYLITHDERFANKSFGSFNNLLNQSTLISTAGEKDRSRFFNGLRDKVSLLGK